MTTFSHENLATLRKARGLSQQQLAEKIGAHLVTVSKFETGKMPLTANWAIRFAGALQVDAKEIDPAFASRTVVRLQKSVRDAGYVQSMENGPLLDLEEAETWAHSIEWIGVWSDSLYPAYREGDLLKVAYEKEGARSLDFAYLDRVCVISVEGTYAKAFDIVAVPTRIMGEKIDLLHFNGRHVRNKRFYRIGVVVCVYPRGARTDIDELAK